MGGLTKNQKRDSSGQQLKKCWIRKVLVTTDELVAFNLAKISHLVGKSSATKWNYFKLPDITMQASLPYRFMDL